MASTFSLPFHSSTHFALVPAPTILVNTSFSRSSQEHSSEVTIPSLHWAWDSTRVFFLPAWSLLLRLLLRFCQPQTQPTSVGDSPCSVPAQVSFPPYGILGILSKMTTHVCCPANRSVMNPGLSGRQTFLSEPQRKATIFRDSIYRH